VLVQRPAVEVLADDELDELAEGGGSRESPSPSPSPSPCLCRTEPSRDRLLRRVQSPVLFRNKARSQSYDFGIFNYSSRPERFFKVEKYVCLQNAQGYSWRSNSQS
jgi:hypothetical protein